MVIIFVILCTLPGVSFLFCLFCLVFVYIVLYYSVLPLKVNKVVQIEAGLTDCHFAPDVPAILSSSSCSSLMRSIIAMSVSVSVCMFVCLSARISQKQQCPHFTKFFACVNYGRGSVIIYSSGSIVTMTLS